MTANIQNLPANIAKAISDAVASTVKGDKARTTAVDLMVAAGMKASDMVSPTSRSKTSTATPELFAEINAAIVAGFSATVQKLLAQDIAKVKETDKPTRKYWQMQIGARRNDFETALAKREKAQEAGNGAGSKPRTIEVWIDEFYSAAIKKLENATAAPFDIGHHKTALAKLQKELRAEVKKA